MRSYLLILLALSGLVSCKKAEQTVFTHHGNVYFDIYNEAKDSILYTFAYNPTMPQDTVWLPVRLSGIRSETDRYFTARIEKDSSTAKEGVHYEALKPRYLLAADRGFAYIPFVMKNQDPALSERSVSAIIKLTASDDLGIENPYLIRAKVVFSAKLEKPDWWDQWFPGYYSRVKHELFFLTTGKTKLSTGSQGGLEAPMNLYFVGILTTMLNNPFKWVETNAQKGYVLELVSAESTDYYFYNKSNPAKKTLLRKNAQTGKYYFIDENGKEVI